MMLQQLVMQQIPYLVVGYIFAKIPEIAKAEERK